MCNTFDLNFRPAASTLMTIGFGNMLTLKRFLGVQITFKAMLLLLLKYIFHYLVNSERQKQVFFFFTNV